MNRTPAARMSRLVGGLLSSVAALTMVSATYAGAEEADVLEEVVVTGIRGSLQKVLSIKRNATGIVDGISSQDISDFPGFNITEELGRLPGVAITRTNGEGKSITVRGLATEFVRVTINGQTVTSGNQGREVDFDIFASELFGSASITKTTTASMVEGGLAATVDLRSPRPLDLPDFVLRVSGEGTYGGLSREVDPRLSAMISKQFNDGRLGVLATVAYSETYLRADVSQPWRYIDRGNGFADKASGLYDFDGDGVIDPEFVGAVEARLPRNQLDIRDRERLGITAAVQFQATDDLLLSFDFLRADLFGKRNRYTMDGNLQKNPAARNRDDFKIVDGQIVKGVWTGVNQRSEELIKYADEVTNLFNLEADWDISENWNAFFKVSRSDAFKNIQEESYLIQGNGDFGYELFGDNLFFKFGPAINALDAGNFTLAQAKRKPVNVNDEENSARFDLTYNSDGNGTFRQLKFGAYASERDLDVTKWEGVFSPRLLNGVVVAQGTDAANETTIPIGDFADVLPVSDLFKGFGSIADPATRTWIIANLDRIRETAFFAGPTTTDAMGRKVIVAPLQQGSSFQVNEKTYSAYAQADFEFDNVFVNLGGRIVRTEQTSTGFEPAAVGFSDISIDNKYTDFLPSISIRYDATDDIVVRATANRNITRPTISKLTPGRNLDPNQKLGKSGNPELEPFRVNSFDLSLEWYFSEEALLSASVFYKDMQSFIITDSSDVVIQGSSLFDDEGNSINGQTFDVTRPENGQGGTVKGLELTYQQPFTFLPGFWSGLGVTANYTYADSNVTTKGGIKTTLQGQSKNSYNIVGYFENDLFNVRLAWGWRDKFVKELRQGREVFWRAFGQLDISAKYNINEQTALTFEAINLTNSNALQFDELEARGIEYINTGTTYRLGASFNF